VTRMVPGEPGTITVGVAGSPLGPLRAVVAGLGCHGMGCSGSPPAAARRAPGRPRRRNPRGLTVARTPNCQSRLRPKGKKRADGQGEHDQAFAHRMSSCTCQEVEVGISRPYLKGRASQNDYLALKCGRWFSDYRVC